MLITTGATGKLVPWGLRLSEGEFDTVHRVGVKIPVADALSQQNNKRKDDRSPEDEAPILAISPKSHSVVPSPVEPELETIEESKGPFCRVPFGSVHYGRYHGQ